MNNSDGNTANLGIFSIVMITVTSVVAIRNLPVTALFGSQLISFFLLGAICFLIPSALVASELSSAWPHRGIYVWVKTAFGPKYGFLAIWFQWIENVIWFPTILSFVVGSLAYVISPSLINNKYYLISTIIITHWLLTLLNLYGIHLSAKFSEICGVLGLVLPMLLIIFLGGLWLYQHQPMQVTFTLNNIKPELSKPSLLVSITAVILCFCGMEIATVHGQDVKDPHKTYPRALCISVIFIAATLLLGSLSIAIIVPHDKLSLVSGVMQAFGEVFHVFHLDFLTSLIALGVIIGSLGGISNWIIAANRGLLIALKDNQLAPKLQVQNKRGAPKALLITQAILVSFIAGVFLLMPSVNGSYWILTAITAQIYMGTYILMFLSAIYLRYKHPEVARPFKIPFGKFGLWCTCLLGICAAIFTIIIGFTPPAGINTGNIQHYETLLISGLILLSLPPLLLKRFSF